MAVEPEEPEGFNMTPMIDVTFQLIIFFMLVTDMAQREMEELRLPRAARAVKERFADESLLVVNVRADGSVYIQGRPYFAPPAPGRRPDARRLQEVFAARRQMKIYQEVPGEPTHVRYPLLIRADRSAPWQWVQMIMMIAAKEGGVTRVQMGAMQEEGR